jgi:hypothetical protein
MKPLLFAALLIGAFVVLSCEEQQVTAPQPAVSLNKTATVPANPCVADRDHDRKDAPVQILCAITVPDNPLANVAKGWFSHERNAVYIADQSNKGVDVIGLRSYAYQGRVTGFVGVATAGGGTATTNGQGPNSMALTGGHHMWVSDGNSQVQVADLHSLSIIATVSTAIAACDGGTATTHYCGRDNEMTYDPDDHIIIVVNPNPLDRTTHAAIPAYVSLIDAHPPYPILGTIAFPDARGTPEAPVWNRETHRFLLPVPTCNNAATCDPAKGGTEYIAVINPKTRSVETKFVMPDCHTLMPAITPIPTGMINDMSIDQRHQHVLMPVCGRGEVVFDGRTGAVVNVITEIAGSDETWFNEGDGRFYVAANDPANANTRSLGVIDGRTGLWLQNVPVVGGVIPTASDEPANRAFTTVTASAGVTACTPFGFAASGCVIVFEHEDGRPDGHHDGEHDEHEHGEHDD